MSSIINYLQKREKDQETIEILMSSKTIGEEMKSLHFIYFQTNFDI